jgi:RNA polymerase sigma factor (sigma-70 family)
MNYKTELEILEGCQKRLPQAQTALYNLYKGRLLGICRRYTRTLAEAEDIFQDAFVKIFLKIDSIKKTESLPAWVKSIVINTATDHYRKSLKDSFLTSIEGLEISDTEVEIDFEAIGRDQLLDIITQMPTGYRLAINLYFIDGYKHQEIAEQLGISVNTSKSQLFHAKAWLKDKLQKLNLEISTNYL